MKSMHYKIFQADNLILIKVDDDHHWAAFDRLLADCRYKMVPGSWGFIIATDTVFHAGRCIDEIHEKVHKEYVKEWEPKPGEKILVELQPNSEEPCQRIFFAMDGDQYVCRYAPFVSDYRQKFKSWPHARPLHLEKVPVPSGSCEVFYGVGGKKDGSHAEKKSKDIEIINLRLEVDNLSEILREYEERVSAEKKVIKLDKETLLKNTWDTIKVSQINNVLESIKKQGYEIDILEDE